MAVDTKQNGSNGASIAPASLRADNGGQRTKSGRKRPSSLMQHASELPTVNHSLDEFIAKLHAFRAEYGRENEPFEIQNMGASAYTPDGVKRLEDRGVAEVIVAFRDVYKKQPDPSLEEKLATMRWYADNVIAKSR